MTRDYDDWQDKPKGTFNDKTNTTPDVDINYTIGELTPTQVEQLSTLRRIEILEYKAKEFEELSRNFTDDHEGRITTLEESKEHHFRYHEQQQDIIDNRVKSLEDRNDKWEEWKQLVEQCNSDESAMKGMYIQELQNKVKALEDWKEGLDEEVHHLDHVMILNRIDKLENLNKLEVFRHNDITFYTTSKDDGKKIQDALVYQFIHDDKRLPNPSGDMCVTRKIRIDREVWDDIKNTITLRGIGWNRLVALIKKVEPDWEPDKK